MGGTHVIYLQKMIYGRRPKMGWIYSKKRGEGLKNTIGHIEGISIQNYFHDHEK